MPKRTEKWNDGILEYCKISIGVHCLYAMLNATHKQRVQELIEIQNIHVIARSEATKQSV